MGVRKNADEVESVQPLPSLEADLMLQTDKLWEMRWSPNHAYPLLSD